MRRIVVAIAVVLIGMLWAQPASAHVTVNPKSVDKGSYAKLTFRVPNEKPDASTTKLEIELPSEKPFEFVGIQPVTGWKYELTKNGDAISKITWSSQDGNAVKPGEFQEFNVSLGPVPSDVSSLTFKALQTYSNGEIVRWIETTTGAEHPAPVLTLTDKQAATTVAAAAAAVDQSDVDQARNLGIAGTVLGALALLLAVLALLRKR